MILATNISQQKWLRKQLNNAFLIKPNCIWHTTSMEYNIHGRSKTMFYAFFITLWLYFPKKNFSSFIFLRFFKTNIIIVISVVITVFIPIIITIILQERKDRNRQIRRNFWVASIKEKIKEHYMKW